jgi:hypothetical protein
MPSRRLRHPLTFAATIAVVAVGLSPAPASEAAIDPRPLPAALLESVIPATALHVNCKTGNDRNKGTLTQPLRTVRAATSRALHPGAVIGLARGCTWRTTVQLRGDGTAAEPIRLTAYGAGAMPVIDGGSAGSASVVRLAGRHQVVENLRVRNAATYGVEIQGASSRVRSTIVDNAGIGVLLKARGAAAERVTVRHPHMVRNTPGGNDDFGAVGFQVQASNVVISHSSCTDCRAPSHDYGHDGGFVEVWNYADNLDVHDNTSSNTEGILEIGGDRSDSSVRGIKVRNNSFRDSHGGVVLHTDGAFAIADAQIAITGNTITSTGSQDPPILSGDVSNVVFERNTVSTASVVSNSAPARHRCNSITLRGHAQLGYPRHSTERVNGRATCS